MAAVEDIVGANTGTGVGAGAAAATALFAVKSASVFCQNTKASENCIIVSSLKHSPV